jgi:hypothetical protein
MEHCPESGYIAWIDNSNSFNMVVRGKTPEEAAKELFLSLKVAICHAFGADLQDVTAKLFASEAEMLKSLQKEGKREIQFQVA